MDFVPQPAEHTPPKRPHRRKPSGALAEEINTLRAMIRTAQELVKGQESTKELVAVLQAVSRASAALANLLRTEKALEESGSGGDLLDQALDEIESEMRRKGGVSPLTGEVSE